MKIEEHEWREHGTDQEINKSGQLRQVSQLIFLGTLEFYKVSLVVLPLWGEGASL